MSLEGVESLNTNNNIEISNEGNTTIFNEQRSFEDLDTLMLCLCDEGNTLYEKENVIIFNECYKV